MSIPLKFTSLKLRNFLSFGNSLTQIDLSLDGSTLIQGENVDTGSANGAGKTTIINALCYALYNKPFDTISLQRLINATNASKTTLMEVILTFQKGDDEYEIYRCRGETYNIRVTMNGDDITLDSVAENDRLVEELIGMSYELFTKIVIFSGNSIPFLQMPVSQQRSQIEELFSITLLTEKAVRLKEIIRETETAIGIQEAVIKEQEAAVNLYNKQLLEAKNRITRWDTDREKQIQATKDEIQLMTGLLSDIDMEEEKELHALISTLKQQESDVGAKYHVAVKDLTSIRSDVKKLSDEISHLVDDKCPYCLQAYEGASHKLYEKEHNLTSKKTRLHELEEIVLKLGADRDDLVKNRTLAEGLIRFTSLSEASKAESSIAVAQQHIASLQNSVNPHVEAYETLLQSSVTTVARDQLDILKKDLEHQTFLLKLLIDKNSFVRRKIINRTIPFLNARLVHYTRELGLPHTVKFDDDMSCTVSEYGRELDFGNLSSGEKKRVNLSMSLAFRDVLHHLHSRVNCLFIDEIDASLDGAGVEHVFKLLKNKSRDEAISLWIISHRPEAVGRFDHTVTVRKEGGFSRLLDEHGEELQAA
jgi:DNA repair exonuclease SbcCD ATPase subunit